MAQVNLKEFQESLARRLRDAAEVEPTTRLGLEAGGQRYLLKLDEAGEVLPLPRLSPVPLTRDWFLGLANVRGNLVGVVDLGRFSGAAATAQSADARLALFAERFGARTSLLVARMLGLKKLSLFVRCDRGAAPDWVGECYAEKEGGTTVWNELDLSRLVTDEKFLQVNR